LPVDAVPLPQASFALLLSVESSCSPAHSFLAGLLIVVSLWDRKGIAETSVFLSW